MRLEHTLVLLWLPVFLLSLECPVGEIVRNTVLDRDEGRTVKTDCAVFWPTAHNGTCKKFKYRVVNYSKVYYACGRCDGTGTKTGDLEYGPYAISKTLKVLTPKEHDPKQKVEEGECVMCTEDNCFESIAGRDYNSGAVLSLSTSLFLSLLASYLLC